MCGRPSHWGPFSWYFLRFQDCCEWRISFLPFFVGWAVAALQLPYVMLAWWLHFKEHHDVLMWCKLQFSNVAMLSSEQKAQVASSLTPKRRLKVYRDRIGATNVWVISPTCILAPNYFHRQICSGSLAWSQRDSGGGLSGPRQEMWVPLSKDCMYCRWIRWIRLQKFYVNIIISCI